MNEHLSILTSHYDTSDKCVCDIGAGDGAFAASLTKLGAIVTAIELDEVHVRAIRQEYGDTITAHLGAAEALPLPDNSQDLVCLIFSFHHIPLANQEMAIAEIKRVLKPDGRLHVAEPKPYGQQTDVLKYVDDEAEVRTATQDFLSKLPQHGYFELVAEDEYELTRIYTDFDQLVSRLVMNDPARANNLPSVKERMEQAFVENSKKIKTGWSLDQPCISYHFKMGA